MNKQLLNFSKLTLPILLIGIVLMGSGCEKEKEDSLVLKTDSITSTIKYESDGIIYEYYLLNDNQIPSVEFAKGENFTFVFSITNNRDEILYHYPDYAYSNTSDFMKVYANKHIDYGKPFDLIGVEKIGLGGHELKPNESFTFTQKWSISEDFHWKYGSYKANNKETLPIGKYYTKLDQIFEFQFENKTQPIKHQLLLQINFEII
jgi:hypothetical protein